VKEEVFVAVVIGLTPKVEGKGRSDTSGFHTAQGAHGIATAPPGHPARGRVVLSRQISWLAGQCCCPVFPKPFQASVTTVDSGSPLTVAGAAPALHRIPSWPRKTHPEELRRLQL